MSIGAREPGDRRADTPSAAEREAGRAVRRRIGRVRRLDGNACGNEQPRCNDK